MGELREESTSATQWFSRFDARVWFFMPSRVMILLMRQVIKALGVLTLLVGLSFPSQAMALDSLVLGGDLSYAHEFTGDGHPGGGAGFHIWYSFASWVAVGGTVAWAGHSAPGVDGENELRNVITAAAGIYFIVDIIRVIPYLAVLPGIAISIQDETEVDYLLQISGGIDVMVNARLTTGVELSYQLLVGDDILPARLVASVRMSWRNVIF